MGNPSTPEPERQPRGGALALCLGDPGGIGAEVSLKALAALHQRRIPVVLVGCRRWLERSFQQLRPLSPEPLADPANFEVIDLPLDEAAETDSGATGGEASFRWLTAAVGLVQSGRCRSLVTAPIAKAGWHAAGHGYPGQTERLAELAGGRAVSMLFTACSPTGHWRFNTLLATTHIPLAAVPRHLNGALVQAKLDALAGFCQRFSRHPRLVVAGLNPHAGEAGQLGQEEQDWLIPALARWQQAHPEVRLEGPLPPDTCWLEAANAWRSDTPGPDGYLALYHDQGLIPVKLLAFDAAVNTTLGLPFLRTSPDHGTGFAIAGLGMARAASMEAAILTAWELG
jgi:4-hydroxythreonine-4-phosphate dehydrogenase